LTPVDPLRLAVWLSRILDRVGIKYLVGGSVASSLMGEPRSTLDLDVMIERDVTKVRALVQLLAAECYVDEETAIDAVNELRSFNAIHLVTSMKIDFFVPESLFAEKQLSRRRAVKLPTGEVLYFYKAEDLIVRKLLWYRLGGEVSERQWRDVTGVLRSSRQEIDSENLAAEAESAGVDDLLRRALREL